MSKIYKSQNNETLDRILKSKIFYLFFLFVLRITKFILVLKFYYSYRYVFHISLTRNRWKSLSHHSVLGSDQYLVKTNPASGIVTVLQYLSARVGSRSRLTRLSRTVTSLTLRDIASPRINCIRASASASAVAISIATAAAAAATILRPSINRAELRPVGVFTYMCACVYACMRPFIRAQLCRSYYFAPKSDDYFN